MKKLARRRAAFGASRALVGLTAATGFLVGLTFSLLLWSVAAPGSMVTVIAAQVPYPASDLDDWQVQAIAAIVLLLFGLWLQSLAALRELASMMQDPDLAPGSLIRQTRRRAIGFAILALVWSLAGQVPISAIATIGDPLGRSVLSLQIGTLTFVSLVLVGLSLFAFRALSPDEFTGSSWLAPLSPTKTDKGRM